MKSNKFLKIALMVLIIAGISGMITKPMDVTLSNPKIANPWQFIVLGDTRQAIGYWVEEIQAYNTDNASCPIRAQMFNNIAANNPNMEFLIHTGDMVKSGGEQDDWDRYFEDIANFTAKNTSIYYAIGNHELYNYALGDGIYAPADEDFSVYEANVDLPGNERYYSFDYNDQVHVIVINTEEYWEGGDNGVFDITSEQLDWIKADLKSNTIDFVITVYHRPSYSILRVGRVTAAQEIRRVLEPLFVEYKVDLVFSGHDHYYYRTQRNGTTYIVTGGVNEDLAVDGDRSEWQEGDVYFSDYHYCNVTVNEYEGQVNLTIDTLIYDPETDTTSKADTITISSNNTSSSSSTPLYQIPIFLGLVLYCQHRKVSKK
ncbi:MAG: hypothetical protein EAX86_04710 [Candidatus Heimdallarchaeota archaeon]|nr:hypothetical protein [Candidatus Heimdallarchaeota archaeon]